MSDAKQRFSVNRAEGAVYKDLVDRALGLGHRLVERARQGLCHRADGRVDRRQPGRRRRRGERRGREEEGEGS